ncbi:MAG: DEAD/DEAH box helicase [Pseudoflavonifractor sp.]|nr:DEAD/DEAH box helicase [Alloprevotella sp.]MCM1116059.1 DEAD/DEAH box helicase [Pseudoflavonifractor sp.]
MRFDETALSDDILDALDAMQFVDCSPIQEKAIPEILDGHDLIAVAQTGTGKTAAYLLPVIDMIADQPESTAPVCIVMAPTRELAQQIDRQMEGFSYYIPVTSVAIYGGTDGKTFAAQQRGLKNGADVVIATPGRLIAHLQMGYVDLSQVKYFILDEADRMLDMGFYDDIMQIAAKLPRDRQTLMFSATMPPRIQELASKILKPDAAEVKIAVSRPTEAIEQSAYVCYDGQKTGIIKHLLKNVASNRVIVFASSKLNVKDLARTLIKAGIKAAEIHSDLDQDRRDEVMNDFRADRIDVLVATDILARGIDIDDIALVVNYEVPREAEDYVHRIGRTARAGAGGKAVTLINPKEQSKFGQIEKFLGYQVKKNEMPEGMEPGPAYEPSKRRPSGGGDHRSGGNGRCDGKGGRQHQRGPSGNGSRGGHKPQAHAKVTGDRPRSEKTPRPQQAASAPRPQKAPAQTTQPAKASSGKPRHGRHGRGRRHSGSDKNQ